MVFKLSGDEVCNVAQRLGCIKDLSEKSASHVLRLSYASYPKLIYEEGTYIFHHPNCLLRYPNKIILLPFNFRPPFIANRQILLSLPTFRLRLRSIQAQPRTLHASSCPSSEHQVSIQRRVPSRQKPLLDLLILRQTSLSHFLARNGIFLEGRRERIFAVRG